MKKMHNSCFLEIECKKCGGKQKVFNKPAKEINCNGCGELLAKPKASHPEFTKNAEIIKEKKEDKIVEKTSE